MAAQIGGDIFLLHREDSTASTRRRSTQVARRTHDTLPRLVTTMDGDNSRSPVQTSPLLVVYSPPVSRRGSFAGETSPTKSFEEIDITEVKQEGSSSALDPSSIPLRVIYSPSVSRSGSVGQSDRPSIVLTHEDEPAIDVQILGPDDDSSPSQPFQAASFPESGVHRRSRGNSNASNMERRGWGSNPPSPSQYSVRRSSSPTRRLAFEEEGHREYGRMAPVFTAFAEKRWFRPILVAKIILGIVICCVLGNLIYT